MDTQEKDKDFSKISHTIIDSRLLDKLSPSELKVYLVINRFANYKTGLSYPTVKTIRELSGVDKNDIAPATKHLAQLGLIEKARTGKRFSFRNCYRVIKNPKINMGTIPIKTDKRRMYFKGKDGKFKPIPPNTDNNVPDNTDKVCPPNTELDIVPIDTDKKEKYRDNVNRDSNIEKESAGSASACLISQASPASLKRKKSLSQVTNETLYTFRDQLGGSEALKTYLLKLGYPQEEVEDLRL